MSIGDILDALEGLIDRLPEPTPEDRERRRLAALAKPKQPPTERPLFDFDLGFDEDDEDGPGEGAVRCSALHIRQGDGPGDHMLAFRFVTCPVTQEYCTGPERCVLRTRGNPVVGGAEEN